VPVPCFLLFLRFRKATEEIFLELDEIKAKPPIFPEHESESKVEMEGARTWPHPRVARARPWPRHQGVSPLVHLQTPPFRLYIPLDGKNLKTQSIFHETYCKPPSLLTQDWESPEALSGTPPERGITDQGLLHYHGRLWSDV
jgi:hypothetical protein